MKVAAGVAWVVAISTLNQMPEQVRERILERYDGDGDGELSELESMREQFRGGGRGGRGGGGAVDPIPAKPNDRTPRVEARSTRFFMASVPLSPWQEPPDMCFRRSCPHFLVFLPEPMTSDPLRPHAFPAASVGIHLWPILRPVH